MIARGPWLRLRESSFEGRAMNRAFPPDKTWTARRGCRTAFGPRPAEQPRPGHSGRRCFRSMRMARWSSRRRSAQILLR